MRLNIKYNISNKQNQARIFRKEMIKKNSKEWRNLLIKIKKCKNKVNEDKICVKCWEVLEGWKIIAHEMN